jgi:hypothetical protein
MKTRASASAVLQAEIDGEEAPDLNVAVRREAGTAPVVGIKRKKLVGWRCILNSRI